MRGLVLAAVLLAVCDAPASDAAVMPTPGQSDRRIRTALYSSDEVYRLDGALGYAIDLEFAPGESCTGVAGGDIESLSLAANGNRLTIKPKLAPIATNLTVITTARTYRIDYRVTPASAHVESAMYVVRFTYPEVRQSQATRIDEALEHARPIVNTD